MIRVALNHKSIYHYDRKVEMGPQVVRLRPAPHCRTPICSYSLKVEPAEHFINWQQDPHSNYLARLVFQEETDKFEVEVDLVAEMTVINPFEFFLEPDAEEFPFKYEKVLGKDLQPFLGQHPEHDVFDEWVRSVDVTSRRTIDFLVDLNVKTQKAISYVIRMEPGVQTPEETLTKGSGSCRDSAWLLVQTLRRLGMAARFVSGYLIQLKPDVESLDGPSGAAEDFTDLHAWAEVFLPGAGWIGLDPTSGLFAGEGHIPLACTPEPQTAAPVSGMTSKCEVEFHHEMSVTRVYEDPRVTKPYTEEQWREIESLGDKIDARLEKGGVRLTMGGEPTFVSMDDMDGDEWNTAAVGPTKRVLAGKLIDRLSKRFAPGGLIHFGQGKWYPGESLPRWALTCMWRTDGEVLWKNKSLLASPEVSEGHTINEAKDFGVKLAKELGVEERHVSLAYEDAMYYLWKERRLSVNADVRNADLDDEEERARLAKIFEHGLGEPTGCMLPLMHQWWNAQARWASGQWPLRSEHLFLIPGDSPMGLRLPLDSLGKDTSGIDFKPVVPFDPAAPLPAYEDLGQPLMQRGPEAEKAAAVAAALPPDNIIRTAMCIESRNGILHVFMPPVERLEAYVELLAAVETTAEKTGTPVIIEGYLPPPDYRLKLIKVTPDPGVIEVNIHPAHNWRELVDITSGVYEDAHYSRLRTEKFDTDGTHTGTGGGNHIVLGSITPSDSPFLRRPALLRSLVAYWHNHPSLSYLFSGRFIGPTSQAPRVDEGRRDSIYELEIAFEQIPDGGECPPSLVDRAFRHLLVDLTGNTHRAEFCIDKLFSPDSSTGRLGLVELRAFEMPPHWQMSLTQQLLIRALVARFWEKPYKAPLADWHTSIHDRWMLPHFIGEDFAQVIEDLNEDGVALQEEWFAPHFEFRFPMIGEIQKRSMHLELRLAIEPWYVLGEEPAGGATARYVDSSVERMQVKLSGATDSRYMVTCNGRNVPLRATGKEGESVAGVRYRAWQPPSCLHPMIPSDDPLVFDIFDTWSGRSIGGCRYHVGHPGGVNSGVFPVNAYEAESRRATRFIRHGHTGGPVQQPTPEPNPRFPMTLDLRRNRGTTE